MSGSSLAGAAPTSGMDRAYFVLVAVVSAAAIGFLTWLLVLRTAAGIGTDVSFLPAANASFNATSALCLVLGTIAIKRGRPQVHRTMMLLALLASTLFLVSYVVYHYAHGDTKYAGEGAMRALYFFVLITHVVLSIPIVPAALLAVYFAFTRRLTWHTRITRWLMPVWLYVSVTGVLVFFLLRQ